jgi:hypothetical protein
MRLRDGRYECAHCGAVLDVPLFTEPQVTIVASSGEPNRRTLKLGDREIHTCVVGEPSVIGSVARMP